VTFREPLRVAASTPTAPPPSGGDWIAVATDGRWWWDGTRWESTVQSPWPTRPPGPVAAFVNQHPPRSAVRPVGILLGLPLRRVGAWRFRIFSRPAAAASRLPATRTP
jgi:hypothetical protein